MGDCSKNGKARIHYENIQNRQYYIRENKQFGGPQGLRMMEHDEMLTKTLYKNRPEYLPIYSQRTINNIPNLILTKLL